MSHPYSKYLSKIRASESGGNDRAHNPHGASGRYQFLPSTWTNMGYNIKDIYNPQLQEEAAYRLTSQNANYLKKRLGIEPTDADLYGAHFLGPAGYSKLYQTPNNAPISTVMSPLEISYNPFVKGKTVGFVKNWLAKKMNQPGVEYDDMESSEPVYNPITPEQQAALDAYVAKATAMTQEKIAKENYKSELAKQELEQKQKEQNFLNELNATFRNAKDKQEMSQVQQLQGDGSEYMLAKIQKPTLQTIQTPMVEYKKGGFVVTASNDRKGKTHKVTGPDGTVKYFGDSKLGQHPGDPKRKAAFYARHKKNLKNNPYFRAFARKTWQGGGNFSTPEDWEKHIKGVEHEIGNPNKWTIDGYRKLQSTLNDYKFWRENTPEGKSVFDSHNEPNEYVVSLPDHLKMYKPLNILEKVTPNYQMGGFIPKAQEGGTMSKNK